MPRTAARATQADIARAIRAMHDTGVPEVRVRITPTAVIVEADRPDRSDRDGKRGEAKREKIIVF